MNRKVYKVVIPVLIIIELSFIFLSFMAYSNKDVKEIKEVSEVDRKRFSMFLEQQDGTYKESNDNYWPSVGYQLNKEKTVCSDTKGNVVSDVISFNEGKLTVRSNKSVFCNIYFDIQADISISVTTDGEEGIPTSAGYKAELSCNDADAIFNPKYQRMEISNVSSDKAKCNLNYVQNTDSYTSLKNQVESATGATATFQFGDYSNATALSQSEYGTPTMGYEEYIEEYDEEGYLVSSTTNTYSANLFSYDGSKWVSNNDNFVISDSVTGDVWEFNTTINIPSDGYYELCYMNESSNEYIYYSAGNTSGNINSYTYEEECVKLDKLTTANKLSLSFDAYSEMDESFSFYLKKTTASISETHYRYSGSNPNNYVWFNNEMWRIIGSVPVCLVGECTTKENLIKIIKDESIGGISYQKSNSSVNWGSNSLYSLLNNYYYGKKNGTGSSYCYASSSVKSTCDYSVSGISSNNEDYYGRMVKNVYWPIGYNSYNMTVDNFYRKEYLNSKVSGNVGIISVVDYGYATSNDYYSTQLSSYNTAASTNWLFNGKERILGNHSIINYNGAVLKDYYGEADNVAGFPVRPVVYLNSQVYILSGSGTESDPFILGM